MIFNHSVKVQSSYPVRMISVFLHNVRHLALSVSMKTTFSPQLQLFSLVK